LRRRRIIVAKERRVVSTQKVALSPRADIAPIKAPKSSGKAAVIRRSIKK
jgi:hypothetical protein